MYRENETSCCGVISLSVLSGSMRNYCYLSRQQVLDHRVEKTASACADLLQGSLSTSDCCLHNDLRTKIHPLSSRPSALLSCFSLLQAPRVFRHLPRILEDSEEIDTTDTKLSSLRAEKYSNPSNFFTRTNSRMAPYHAGFSTKINSPPPKHARSKNAQHKDSNKLQRTAT